MQRESLAEDISVEALAELVDLSPFHFSRVFRHATGMSPPPIRDARADHLCAAS